jgi:MFS family permease
MAAQVLAFGFVATMQVFIKNRAGFLALRLMLGFSEAGYIPGGVYTLSTWYTKRELSKRVSVFFFGMFGGNAISPILASGILKLEGAHGIKGWQWLFMRKSTWSAANHSTH